MTNDLAKRIDQCGVCGGNDTLCIGCDGTLYGPKYDNCGVCGGNGATCFNPCEQGSESCESCATSELCGWCSATSSCMSIFASTCTEELKVGSCDSNIAVIVGASIGAGVIAAIAVGGAVALALGVFGGKKGYDAYLRHQNDNMEGVENNPLYDDDGRKGFNPFYGVSQVFKTSFRNLKNSMSSRNLNADA